MAAARLLARLRVGRGQTLEQLVPSFAASAAEAYPACHRVGEFSEAIAVNMLRIAGALGHTVTVLMHAGTTVGYDATRVLPAIIEASIDVTRHVIAKFKSLHPSSHIPYDILLCRMIFETLQRVLDHLRDMGIATKKAPWTGWAEPTVMAALAADFSHARDRLVQAEPNERHLAAYIDGVLARLRGLPREDLRYWRHVNKGQIGPPVPDPWWA